MLGTFIVYNIFYILQCPYIKREASVAPKEKAPAVTGAFGQFFCSVEATRVRRGLEGKKNQPN